MSEFDVIKQLIEDFVNPELDEESHSNSLTLINTYFVVNGDNVNLTKLYIQDIIAILESALTSTKDKERYRAILLISEVLHLNPYYPFTSGVLHLLVSFFDQRLSDYPSVIPSLRSLRCLIKYNHANFDSKYKDFNDILHSVFQNFVDVQSFSQNIRQNIFELLFAIVSIQAGMESCKELNNDFIDCVLTAFEGEKDPRCLLISLELMSSILEAFDYISIESSERIFNALTAYFPITFQSPPSDPYGVTPEMLTTNLQVCLISNLSLVQFVLPYMINIQLFSNSSTGKIHSMRVICGICIKYSVKSLSTIVNSSNSMSAHSQILRLTDGIYENLFDSSHDQFVKQQALQTTYDLCRLIGVSPDSKFKLEWDLFCDVLLTKCQVILDEENDTIMAYNAWSIVCVIASSSFIISKAVVDRMMPILLPNLSIPVSSHGDPNTVSMAIHSFNMLNSLIASTGFHFNNSPRRQDKTINGMSLPLSSPYIFNLCYSVDINKADLDIIMPHELCGSFASLLHMNPLCKHAEIIFDLIIKWDCNQKKSSSQSNESIEFNCVYLETLALLIARVDFVANLPTKMDQLISFVNKTSFAVTGVTFSSQFQREAAEFNKSTKKNSNIFSHFHSLNSLQSASLKLLTTVILLPNYREITVSIFSNLLPSPMRYRHSSTDCKVVSSLETAAFLSYQLYHFGQEDKIPLSILIKCMTRFIDGIIHADCESECLECIRYLFLDEAFFVSNPSVLCERNKALATQFVSNCHIPTSPFHEWCLHNTSTTVNFQSIFCWLVSVITRRVSNEDIQFTGSSDRIDLSTSLVSLIERVVLALPPSAQHDLILQISECDVALLFVEPNESTIEPAISVMFALTVHLNKASPIFNTESNSAKWTMSSALDQISSILTTHLKPNVPNNQILSRSELGLLLKSMQFLAVILNKMRAGAALDNFICQFLRVAILSLIDNMNKTPQYAANLFFWIFRAILIRPRLLLSIGWLEVRSKLLPFDLNVGDDAIVLTSWQEVFIRLQLNLLMQMPSPIPDLIGFNTDILLNSDNDLILNSKIGRINYSTTWRQRYVNEIFAPMYRCVVQKSNNNLTNDCYQACLMTMNTLAIKFPISIFHDFLNELVIVAIQSIQFSVRPLFSRQDIIEIDTLSSSSVSSSRNVLVVKESLDKCVFTKVDISAVVAQSYNSNGDLQYVHKLSSQSVETVNKLLTQSIDLLSSHLTCLIPSLLQIARLHYETKTRVNALRSLLRLTDLPYHQLHPHKGNVLKGLGRILSDRKCVVRLLAAKVRNHWITRQL